MSTDPDLPVTGDPVTPSGAASPQPEQAPDDAADEYSLFDVADPLEVDLSTRSFGRHRVTAVLVAHDGLRWIGRAIDAVQDQARPVQRLYVVDTGSTDGTAELLADRIGPGVESLPRDTGFGAAVAHVLRADRLGPGLPAAAEADLDSDGPTIDWVWLLHDDCAPEPEALRHLLAAVDERPSVAMAGPKIVGWADPRHLLEAGVTIARSGARDTGLERHEQDQGQHDAQRSVLAVSTAGMLVRRDVWEDLGGLDPRLTIFRDDIDFGWRVNAAGHRVLVVPGAVLHHAEAASHRRRRISVGPDQPHRLDRFHAMQVLLANMPTWLLPWVLLRLTVGTVARAIGFLIAKDPGFALAELRALGSTWTHPGAVRAARRARRETRTVSYRDLRGLLAAPGTQLAHGIEILGSAFSSETRRPSRVGTTAARAADERTVPLDPDDETPGDLLAGADTLVRRTLRRPGVVLTLLAFTIAMLAQRSLFGDGVLLGGALLPATDGASDLWSTYVAWWHPVGVGSATPSATYAPVLAVASLVLLGKVTLVIDVLLMLCVPLAAASAYLALRGLVTSVTLRLWAAAAYALLPAATGAVASGRIGTALLLVLLPLLARPALRLGGVLTPEPTWRTAWGTGLALAMLASFVPVLWLLSVVLALVAVATTARGRRSAAMIGATLAVAPLVLLPWSWQLLTHPSYLLVEAGVVSPSTVDPSPNPLATLLLAPGGPGTPPLWVGLGIVAAAIAALLRGVRPRPVTVAFTTALPALALAALLARAMVQTPQLGAAVPAWSGPLLVVAAAALLVAAVLAAEGARTMLAERSFGWRQPVAVVIVALCVLGPVVAALGWVTRGADEPIRRAAVSVLPAFVAADAQSSARPRTLALRADGPGVVAYSLIRGDGVRLADAEVAPAATVAPQLDTVVSDLTSGRGGFAGSALIGYGVRYVVVGATGTSSDGVPTVSNLERTLDGAPGLRRLSSAEGDAVWKVVGVTGRARLVPERGSAGSGAAGSGAAARKTVVVPSQPVTIDTPLPAGWAGGTLELAEAADPGWSASVDGRALTRTEIDGWSQGFVVPAGAGRLQVSFENPARSRWLLLQGALLVVVVVLALPSRRRDGEGEDA